jgi:RNA polymerase sigma-70 factor (ECF subfamily)
VIDFKTLVQKAQTGDSAAFSILYTELYTPIFKYALSRTRNRELAEDISQDVFVKFLENINSYSSQKETPLPYLFTIARNLIINAALKKKPDLFAEDEEETLVSEEPGELQKLRDREEFNLILETLQILPSDQSEVIRLRYLSELETKEIAEILQKSEVNVRKLESRGLQKIRELLN